MNHFKKYHLSDQSFMYLKILIENLTGIDLGDYKKQFIYNRVLNRVKELNLTDFDDYCALLNKGDPIEIELFTNALTTNLTSFFRGHAHFSFLKKAVPEIYKKKQQIRVWSAGCATGEEAYSIAITLMEALNGGINSKIKIFATDIDTKVLSHAKSGIYDLETISGLSNHVIKKWFLKGIRFNDGQIKVKSELKQYISFQELNLINHWPWPFNFDIIFCRNVLIYFNKNTKTEIIHRLAEKLQKHGILIVGYSENLLEADKEFKLIGKCIYERL